MGLFHHTLTPTPLELLAQLSTPQTALWVKRDDLSHPLYGGNKVRKLRRLLADAERVGSKKLVTMGSLGSHHVLATGVFGRLAGFGVEAALLPQPGSAHVLQTLRASIAQGVRVVAVGSYAEAARHLAAAESGTYVIPAGGSSLVGTLGVLDAAAELVLQVRSAVMPEPDLVVVPLGSGGTAAGLVAGLSRAGLRTHVLAVAVAQPVKAFAAKARSLARQLVDASLHERLHEHLEITVDYLGPGYGTATGAGERATRLANEQGLSLDATYTAKAFAAALDRVALGRYRNVLFWHTLSAAPLAPLLDGAPLETELSEALPQLVLR